MKALFLTLVAARLAALAVPAAAAPQPDRVGPSFDCAAAKDTIDRTICGDSGLAEADALMARLYSATKISAFGRGPSGELAAQRKWLADRAKDCERPRTPWKTRGECLADYNKDRNHALAVAALFSEPDLALATLKRLDPEAAPLYEAIVLYATAPTLQRERIAPLLKPYFDKFNANDDLVFGRSILEEDKIRSPVDALQSEHKFTEFLEITSAYLGGDPIPRPFPCAAIVRKPGLLGAMGPVFGSTLDNFVFYPDCDTTLPPLPAFDRLIRKINDSWPDCDGTIRFAAYRGYDSAQMAARLAGPRELGAFARSAAGQGKARVRQVRGVPPTLVTATIGELAGYYQTYQKVSPATAKSAARAAVHDLMAGAHACD
jgi:uncharacterized protein YecT (DUF1311 family)